MKIDRKMFLSVLESVKPGLAAKEIIEQSTSFVFKDGFVFTYNDSLAVSAPIGEEMGLEGAVKADELFRLLQKCGSDEIELYSTDTEIRVKGDKFKAGVKRESEITLPLDELKYPEKWVKVSEDFTKAVKSCLFSVSKDMTKPKLTCIHITPEKVESSDNFRATIYPLKTGVSSDIMLPGMAARSLVNYNVTGYNTKGGWLHFTDKKTGLIFSTRTYSEDFPEIESRLDEADETFKMPKEISELLDNANIFITADFSFDAQVRLTIKDGSAR